MQRASNNFTFPFRGPTGSDAKTVLQVCKKKGYQALLGPGPPYLMRIELVLVFQQPHLHVIFGNGFAEYGFA